MSRLLLGNDQFSERVVVYDLQLLQKDDPLEKGEIWSVASGHVSTVKYRENTVFGDVVLTGGYDSRIFSYPSGEMIWSTKQSGNNTHAVEILPSGNLVFVNSTGNDLRLFRTSALLTGDKQTAATFESYPFYGTHGVLWDPVFECLWVLGDCDFAAYRVVGQGADERLETIEGKSLSLVPYGDGGHDLMPDLTDSRYLYCSVRDGILRVDKQTLAVEHLLQGTGHYKAFAQMEDGSFCFIHPDKAFRRRDLSGWWKQSWCADNVGLLHFAQDGTPVVERIYAQTAAFYKIRPLYGKYL